ncbi:hypothetical protein MMC20_002582 [Loxospora ochrophaea]|nr:hypothetical protein [Loxospora ochrophaea]
MAWFFRTAPRPASRSPTPDSALIRQGPIPPTLSQIRQRESRFRIHFNSHGATAKGYPSTGGVLVKGLNAVDLVYLGASRHEETLRPTMDASPEEDAWCVKLRKLAPRWYRNVKDRDDAVFGDRPTTKAEEEQVFVGYEDDSNGGGIWVMQWVHGQRPVGWGRYELCLTMQERCRAMEELGATRYQHADEVEALTESYDERRKRERDELEETYGSLEYPEGSFL